MENNNNINNVTVSDQRLRARKKRIPLTLEKLKLIETMDEKGDSVSIISERLNLSKSTVYKKLEKIYLCKEQGKNVSGLIKKPGPKVMEANEKSMILSDIVQEDNELTQQGMVSKLKESGIFVSQATVSNCLKKLDITRKRLKLRSSVVLNDELIHKRKIYAREFLRDMINKRLFFLDETGFNLHISKSYGYSPKNVDAIRHVPSNRGRNLSLLAIISDVKVMNYKLLSGPYNTENFLAFLNDCFLQNIFESNSILIMDNVKFHHSDSVKRFLQERNINFKYLPAYSPSLNPIEEVFSALKARYTSYRPRPTSINEMCELLNTLISFMNDNDSFNFQNLYFHIHEFVRKAYNGEQF